MQRIVITGGPGAGKTSLLAALQARGFAVVGDSARSVIQSRRERGLTARPGAAEFAHLVLRIDVENFDRHAATPGPVFFERGVVDSLGMLDEAAPLGDAELASWLSRYRYFPKVFLLPPWRAIYTNDAERDHTFAHAQRVHAATAAWYRRCGYETLDVPKAPVDTRCESIVDRVVNHWQAAPNPPGACR